MRNAIEWIDVVDTARILGVSQASARRLAKQLGAIKVLRGTRQVWRFDAAIVRAYAEARRLAERSAR